jgi:hypothetical protein
VNPDKPDKPDRPTPGASKDRRDDSEKTTPAADMQPEDAGTDASAQPDDAQGGDAAGSTPAGKAMKQQSKTDAERR